MRKFKNASDIEVGVIGYGAAFNMGRMQLNDMRSAGMTPLAVTELDAERRAVAAQEFPGIEVYASVEEMLKKSSVNLVAVITPHNTHAELALKCLKAGRHVVCEKPFAITTGECDRMIREAKKQELVLTAYHNRHWDGCIVEAVKHIREKKEIGDVYRVEAHLGQRNMPGDWWRSSKSISGGILYDWGVHILEYCLQIIEGDILEVTAYAKTGYWKTHWMEDTIENEATAITRFSNGAMLSVSMTTLDCNPKRGMVEFTGSEGSYIMNHDTYELIKPKKNTMQSIRGKNRDGQWPMFYRNIADHMVKGAELVITPEWARRPIHILDLAGRSITTGKAQKAKYA